MARDREPAEQNQTSTSDEFPSPLDYLRLKLFDNNPLSTTELAQLSGLSETGITKLSGKNSSRGALLNPSREPWSTDGRGKVKTTYSTSDCLKALIYAVEISDGAERQVAFDQAKRGWYSADTDLIRRVLQHIGIDEEYLKTHDLDSVRQGIGDRAMRLIGYSAEN